MSSSELDIIGIGALNLDYELYVTSGLLDRRDPTMVTTINSVAAASAGTFEWHTETFVDMETIEATLAKLGASSVRMRLGGSAFNAITTAAQFGIGLRLGYVGVEGKVPAPGLSFRGFMDRIGIDTSHVHTEDGGSGICLCYVENADRTMLTSPGANVALASYLDENFDDVVAYLASARVVHVTSFLDKETPSRVLKVLRAAKERTPQLRIVCDPGHTWTVTPDQTVMQIMGLSDFLLLNEKEFWLLAKWFPPAAGGGSGSEWPAAEHISGLYAQLGTAPTVLVKRPDRILVMSPRVPTSDLLQTPLSVHEIKNPTGAGDIFAAGLLATLGYSELQASLGAMVGMRLARNHLRDVALQADSVASTLAKQANIEPLEVERPGDATILTER